MSVHHYYLSIFESESNDKAHSLKKSNAGLFIPKWKAVTFKHICLYLRNADWAYFLPDTLLADACFFLTVDIGFAALKWGEFLATQYVPLGVNLWLRSCIFSFFNDLFGASSTFWTFGYVVIFKDADIKKKGELLSRKQQTNSSGAFPLNWNELLCPVKLL